MEIGSIEKVNESNLESKEKKKIETVSLELNQSSVSNDDEKVIVTPKESDIKSASDIRSGIKELQGLIDGDQSPKPISASREIPKTTLGSEVTSEGVFLLDSGENSPGYLMKNIQEKP